MGKETALPKNIRQIGEVRGEEKICLEDYVMTCIHKKEKQEKEGYLGIFFGERRQENGTEYVFIRGMLELSRQWESENFAEKLEEQRKKYFPDWNVQGCCVIGVYDTDRIREMRTRIEDAGRVVYHLQEQEETLYVQRNGAYHKMKGYFIFYEQNRKMQNYLSEEFKEDRVEKESFPDKAIKSFREKVRSKSERKSSSMLKMASSFFVVTVLAVAAITVTKMDDLRKVRQTLSREEHALENETLENEAGEKEAQDKIYLDTAGIKQQETVFATGNSEGDDTDETNGALTAENTESVSAADENSVSKTLETGILDTKESEEKENRERVGGNKTASDGLPAGSYATDDSALASAAAPSGDSTLASAATSSDDPTLASAATSSDDPTLASAATSSDDPALASAAAPSDDPALASAATRRTQATYIIREGDTLADICSKYYGNFDKLDLVCSANGITDANLILPGQKIVLP